jgi:hypothetical protein
MELLRKILAIVSMFSLVAVYAPGMAAQQAAPATSETSTPAPAAGQATPATSADPAKVTLKEGTDVNLKLAQSLSSKTAATGDSVELVLDQDLIVANSVVAKKGSRAVATVSNAKKAGMAGKGGELNLRLEYLKAGDTRVKLRGVQAKNGDNKTGATVGLVLAFGVLGFMKHGKQAEAKEGTPIKAYIDEDVQLASLGTAPETAASAASNPAPAAAPNPAPAPK